MDINDDPRVLNTLLPPTPDGHLLCDPPAFQRLEQTPGKPFGELLWTPLTLPRHWKLVSPEQVKGTLAVCPFLHMVSTDALVIRNLSTYFARWHLVPFRGFVEDYYTQDGVFHEGAATELKRAVVNEMLTSAKAILRPVKSCLHRETSVSVLLMGATLWDDFLQMVLHRTCMHGPPLGPPSPLDAEHVRVWAVMQTVLQGTNQEKQVAEQTRLLLSALDSFAMRVTDWIDPVFMDDSGFEQRVKHFSFGGDRDPGVLPLPVHKSVHFSLDEFIAVTVTECAKRAEFVSGQLDQFALAAFDRMIVLHDIALEEKRRKEEEKERRMQQQQKQQPRSQETKKTTKKKTHVNAISLED